MPPRRRQALEMAGAAALLGVLGGCSSVAPTAGSSAAGTGNAANARRLQLAPLQATTDRITAVTVCTRPFRAQGPRLDVERIGEQTVVHNYGHGGSGWSLSWGSGSIAVAHAMATGERHIGVLGCGALGLTAALLAQRAGADVTIYARELPPQTRSTLASGVWTPDSRICLEASATPEFRGRWEAMTRDSFRNFQSLLGLADAPIEFYDLYMVSDGPDLRRRPPDPADTRPRFAELKHALIDDLIPDVTDYAPGEHPFGERHVRRSTSLMFNLAAYQRLLLAEFHANGGRIEVREFGTPADLAALPQRTLINATGYGARALFGDTSLVPVRGQIARMIPQTDIRYGLFYRNISFVPRRDGMVFQDVGPNDYFGFDDDSLDPHRAEAENAVRTIASLYA